MSSKDSTRCQGCGLKFENPTNPNRQEPTTLREGDSDYCVVCVKRQQFRNSDFNVQELK